MILIDEQFLPQAIATISSARRRIDISTFKAEDTSLPRGRNLHVLFELLFKKKSEGIEINFLINWNHEKRAVPLTNLSVIHELKKHKINVRMLPERRCCHAKIIIVDQKTAIIGSHNLGVKSCHYNFEMSYLIMDPIQVAMLANVYDHTLLNSLIP